MNKFYLYTNFLSPGRIQRVIIHYTGIVLPVIKSITFADSFLSSSFAALKLNLSVRQLTGF